MVTSPVLFMNIEIWFSCSVLLYSLDLFLTIKHVKKHS